MTTTTIYYYYYYYYDDDSGGGGGGGGGGGVCNYWDVGALWAYQYRGARMQFEGQGACYF